APTWCCRRSPGCAWTNSWRHDRRPPARATAGRQRRSRASNRSGGSNMQSRTSRKPGAVMARYALSAAIAAVLAGPALAQEQDEGARSQQDNQNITSLDTIVVSGTATSGGVKKLEASFNIV